MAAQAELPERLARRVMSWRTLALAAAALILAGAALVPLLYGQRWARADQFEEVKAKVIRHDAVIDYMHDDLEQIKAQETENARAVGARVVTGPHKQ